MENQLLSPVTAGITGLVETLKAGAGKAFDTYPLMTLAILVLALVSVLMAVLAVICITLRAGMKRASSKDVLNTLRDISARGGPAAKAAIEALERIHARRN